MKKQLRNLFAAMAIAGTSGAVFALERQTHLDMPIPAARPSEHIVLLPGDAMPYTFADLCNLMIDTLYPPVRHPATAAGPSHGFAADWPAPDGGEPPPFIDSSIMGSGFAVAAIGPEPMSAAWTRTGAPGKGSAPVGLPLPATPTTAEWMLLCGLVFTASMARRRRVSPPMKIGGPAMAAPVHAGGV